VQVQANKESIVSDETGSPKKAAKKPAASKPSAGLSEEDKALLAEQEAEAAEAREQGNGEPEALEGLQQDVNELREQRLGSLDPDPFVDDEPGGGDEPAEGVVPGLPAELASDLPPAVLAILAAQAQATAAQTAALTKAVETMAERFAGQSGAEITLSGDAQDLLRQLSGTVSDGGDGDNPLDEPVVFISRGRQCNVIKKARNRLTMPDGSQAFTTGVHADFSPNGMFTTRNSEMVEYLKARPGFGNEYWIMGAEPHAQVNPSEILKRIFELAMQLDDGALQELESEERATHKRPAVLQALAAARQQVQAFEGAEA
jgi:hypothetical protein